MVDGRHIRRGSIDDRIEERDKEGVGIDQYSKGSVGMWCTIRIIILRKSNVYMNILIYMYMYYSRYIVIYKHDLNNVDA